MERRPSEQDEERYNATIVVASISCKIARSGRRSRRSFIPPREIESPAPFAHIDGSPKWNPGVLEDREGGDKDMLYQDIDNRGDHIVGIKMGRLVSYRSNYSGEMRCSQHGEV